MSTYEEQQEAQDRRKAEINKRVVKVIALGIGALLLFVALCMCVFPIYNVWSSQMSGKAMFAHAEYARKVQVAQAEGEKEAATLRAQAIAIVGKAATEFPQYRQQEFIGAFAEALKDGKIHQIIYVPTEANIPIIEARGVGGQQVKP